MAKRKQWILFGKLLTALNVELAITQVELARRIGVSSRTVARWKRGRWFPPPAQRLAILHGLRDVARPRVEAMAASLGVPAGSIPVAVRAPRDVDARAAKLALDAAMFAACARLDVSAREVRDAFLPLLARVAELGLDAGEAHALLAAR